ncbi:MAG: hypothetical protein HQL95_00205 [Magnetococcales bacterium]|nr:hypothetical protein [Magnetococcales bacterium]
MNQAILDSICRTTADYRADEGLQPTHDRVIRWVSQFDEEVREDLLIEVDHVLKHTYISKEKMNNFLKNLSFNQELTENNPSNFWTRTGLLAIQKLGNSQKEMYEIFLNILKEKFNIAPPTNHTNIVNFVYMDDGIFSGGHIRGEIGEWIKSVAPIDADVHIIVFASHTGGQYFAETKLNEAIRSSGKTIRLHWWYAVEIEDRKYHINNSDVLRPKSIPQTQQIVKFFNTFQEEYRSPKLRSDDSVGSQKFFRSSAGRNLLEQQFLMVGANILESCQNLTGKKRPLGYAVLETPGFGSMTVTYRNCPNNCPLALWVGYPWIPLFPRKTNQPSF